LHSLSLVIAHYHGGIDEIWLRVLHNSFEVVGLNFIYIWTSNSQASAVSSYLYSSWHQHFYAS